MVAAANENRIQAAAFGAGKRSENGARRAALRILRHFHRLRGRKASAIMDDNACEREAEICGWTRR